MKHLILSLIILNLAACANTSSSGGSQVYGEVSGGVEAVHIE